MKRTTPKVDRIFNWPSGARCLPVVVLLFLGADVTASDQEDAANAEITRTFLVGTWDCDSGSAYQFGQDQTFSHATAGGYELFSMPGSAPADALIVRGDFDVSENLVFMRQLESHLFRAELNKSQELLGDRLGWNYLESSEPFSVEIWHFSPSGPNRVDIYRHGFTFMGETHTPENKQSTTCERLELR